MDGTTMGAPRAYGALLLPSLPVRNYCESSAPYVLPANQPTLHVTGLNEPLLIYI